MFSVEVIRKGIEKVKNAGRLAIRYEIYGDEGEPEEQSITIEQAEKIVKYLSIRPDVWFDSMDEYGNPYFGHPLESLPWVVTWDEMTKEG